MKGGIGMCSGFAKGCIGAAIADGTNYYCKCCCYDNNADDVYFFHFIEWDNAYLPNCFFIDLIFEPGYFTINDY